MKCENCNEDHSGLYGSGRFCSCVCARSFSTKNDRLKINKKISKSRLGIGNKWIESICKNPKCINKFKSKKSDNRKYCSHKCSLNNKPKFSVEAKNNMSIARSNFLKNNKNYNCGYYEFRVGGKKLVVQGTWEKLMAEKLNNLKIKWNRFSIKYGHRRYTPDFYLEDYNLYIEVKGFMRERDKWKMWQVLKSNKIKIIIIESLNEINNFNLNDVKFFEDVYPIDKIDFSKFNNVWSK